MAVEFDFDGPNSLTKEDEAAILKEVIEEAKVETPAPKVEATAEAAQPKQEPTPETTPTEQQTAAPKPSDELMSTAHKVKVNGEELTVTYKDLLEGHMRHRDYTQHKQRFAEEQRQRDDRIRELESTIAQADQFLRDRASIEAYVQRAFGVTPQTGQQVFPQQAPFVGNPDEVITVAQAQQMASNIAAQQAHAEVSRMRAEFEEKLQLERLNMKREASRQLYEVEVERHMKGILDKFPVLKQFENIEEDLMADATKYQPRTLDEAKQRLVDAAERRATIIRSAAEDEAKKSAVAAAKLRKSGTEPPGGSGVKPPPAKELSLDDKDRNALINAAIADVQEWISARNQ